MRGGREAALALGALVVGLAVGELGLRGLGFSDQQFRGPDVIRGVALVPGAEGRYRLEGDAHVRISSAGLRDREHALVGAPGTVRVAVLGDSFAEALQVDVDRAFWAVAGRAMSECLGRPVEMINFGVGGYGTAQEVLTWRHVARRYGPDLVLLAFFAGNDVQNNYRPLHRPDVPYFDLVGDELRLNEDFLAHPDFVRRQSRLRRFLRGAKQHVRLLHLPGALSRPRGGAPPTRWDDPKLAPLYADADGAWGRAWAVTERLLAGLAAETSSAGAPLAMVSIGTPLQVHPDPSVRRRAREAFRVTSLDRTGRRALAAAKAGGALTLDLAPSMRARAEATGRCMHGFGGRHACRGHYNELGHRVAGEAIARWLCDERARVTATRPAGSQVSPSRSAR